MQFSSTASWLMVKNPGERINSFVWWQILFLLINIAAAVVYAMTDSKTLTFLFAFTCALIHFGLLMAVAPLAVEREKRVSGS